MIGVFEVITVLLAFTLATTIRVCISGHLHAGSRALRVLTHSAWLFPLAAVAPLMLGAYYEGLVSPWPPQAFVDFEARGGPWAGAAAALAVCIADLWLLAAAARAGALFAPPDDRHMIKFYYLVNLAFGVVFIGRAAWRHHTGA